MSGLHRNSASHPDLQPLHTLCPGPVFIQGQPMHWAQPKWSCPLTRALVGGTHRVPRPGIRVLHLAQPSTVSEAGFSSHCVLGILQELSVPRALSPPGCSDCADGGEGSKMGETAQANASRRSRGHSCQEDRQSTNAWHQASWALRRVLFTPAPPDLAAGALVSEGH